jgi:hypothetical protein
MAPHIVLKKKSVAKRDSLPSFLGSWKPSIPEAIIDLLLVWMVGVMKHFLQGGFADESVSAIIRPCRIPLFHQGCCDFKATLAATQTIFPTNISG